MIPDKKEIRELIREYGSNKDAALKEKIVLRYINIINYLARRYTRHKQHFEDLTQVACLGLIRAIDRFEPSRGVDFTDFIIPTIIGEIKKYFRDKSMSIRIPRRLHELNLRIRQIMEEFRCRGEGIPSWEEIAACLGVPESLVLEAQGVFNYYFPFSLISIGLKAPGD